MKRKYRTRERRSEWGDSVWKLGTPKGIEKVKPWIFGVTIRSLRGLAAWTGGCGPGKVLHCRLSADGLWEKAHELQDIVGHIGADGKPEW